jgi:hypothetical protein
MQLPLGNTIGGLIAVNAILRKLSADCWRIPGLGFCIQAEILARMQALF